MSATPSAAMDFGRAVLWCVDLATTKPSRVLARTAPLLGVLLLSACQFDSTGTGFGQAGGLAAPNAHGCECACGAAQQFPAAIEAAADDAAEAADGSVALGNASLVLAQSAEEPTLVGLRFDGLEVGPGSIIDQAHVQFTAGNGNSPPSSAFALAVASGADDAGQLPDTTVALTSAALTFQSGELVAVRFTNVLIPPNAIVLSAHVQFEAGASTTGVARIEVHGEKSPDAAPFAALLGDLSSRPQTTAGVPWAPPEWVLGASGLAQRTVDLSAVIEEIAAEPGWEPGNAVVLFFETALGSRLARSFEAGAPAQLEITLALQPQPVTIAIAGEATADAAAFSSASSDLSSRAGTASTVMWDPAGWTDGESGLDQRTPDLSEVIQAIIDEPGWAAGNPLALLFEDMTAGGDRIAAAFDSSAAAAARLIVVAFDPNGTQLQFELAVCMPEDLNPNLEGNDTPTAEELAADCEGRVNDNVEALAVECGYAETCLCHAVMLPSDSDAAYDASCDTGCVGEELDDDCDNFDPANDTKTATHVGDGEPVCLTASSDPPTLPPDPLAAGFFGQVSECELTGNAEILIDGLDDRFPGLTARLRIAGSPCPGQSCAVTTSYLGAVDSFGYEGGFLGAGDTTISEVSVSGASTAQAVLLDASGGGEIPAGETASSGRGRRQTNRIIKDDIDVRSSFVGENANAIAVGVDWEAATCSLDGPLFGGTITDSDPDEDENATESDTTINVVADGMLVNQPPSAAASASALVECTSPAGALVGLNGGASADPDDNITVARWNAESRVGDAVGFGATAAVPQALGLTRSYLHRVIDGFGQAGQDTVSVSVVDTTAPVLHEPDDLEVECLGPEGTPVHLGRAFGQDRCDLDVDVTNDAPMLFPAGNTVVVWTATDDSGNQTMRIQNVRVVDTTPPELDVALDPDALWPPNHKLRTIEATIEVTDVCDPNPIVQLEQIQSDEPDDGTGDGATTDDIQGAALGTDDREFDLRSERQGNGDGRVYSVTYQASDASENTTEETDEVTVPKKQGGKG